MMSGQLLGTRKLSMCVPAVLFCNDSNGNNSEKMMSGR